MLLLFWAAKGVKAQIMLSPLTVESAIFRHKMFMEEKSSGVFEDVTRIPLGSYALIFEDRRSVVVPFKYPVLQVQVNPSSLVPL